jgi:guanylate kinase
MNRLIVLSAPSGTGKTTLCARLLKDIPELMLSVSTTTRKPRGKEIHSREYYFVTEEEFKSSIQNNRFVEWALVHGNYYGTSKDFVELAFSQGKSLLLDIDVQGANSFKAAYPKETVSIFIEPPSMVELEKRLRTRATEDEASIQKRLKNAKEELKSLDRFDHVILNDDIEKAYFSLQGIVLHAIRGKTYA